MATDPFDWPANAAMMRDLDSSLRCTICHEFYNTPKLLPCGHTCALFLVTSSAAGASSLCHMHAQLLLRLQIARNASESREMYKCERALGFALIAERHGSLPT